MTTTQAVRERPIPFSAQMVRAILDGTKTQTRRVVKFPREMPNVYLGAGHDSLHMWRATETWGGILRCPFGQPGDRLWVRETALYLSIAGGPDRDIMYADHDDYDICWPVKGEAVDLGWRVVPSIFMPRWASRITLELTGVRVERVQDINARDAVREGVTEKNGRWCDAKGEDSLLSPIAAYRSLWDSLNAKRGYGWDANPWAWVLTFGAA